MRKFSAIILCAAFITAQYARQVSYLQCSLENYFKSPAQKCDCEKLSGQINEPDNQPQPLVPHGHAHSDESYCMPSTITHQAGIDGPFVTRIIPPCASLAEGFNGIPDRPPRWS